MNTVGYRTSELSYPSFASTISSPTRHSTSIGPIQAFISSIPSRNTAVLPTIGISHQALTAPIPVTSSSEAAVSSDNIETSHSSFLPRSPALVSTSSSIADQATLFTSFVPNAESVTSSAGSSNIIEIAHLRAEVHDLTEKLTTLRLKREEDMLRLKEAEQLKLKAVHLEENRRLMQEQTADLQRNLVQAKMERTQLQQAFDRYKDEMSELTESVEMATLDKEMAEEKLDALTTELETFKDQIEELTLENQILKEESEGKTNSSETTQFTSIHVKQLEQQNERMKLALVKLRDLTGQDKQDIASLNKELHVLRIENDNLTIEKDRLEHELHKAHEHSIDLREQIDATLGSEQMVTELTQRNLALEERISALIEERNDLEALCEMNDELQENARDVELELRESLESEQTRLAELQRRMEAACDSLAERDQTLSRFRDLVTDLQTQLACLRKTLAEERRSHRLQPLQLGRQDLVTPEETALMTSMDTRAASLLDTTGLAQGLDGQTTFKVIESELRRLDAEQGLKHAQLLASFLPDSFMRRGGDNDSLLVLLLIDRFIAKAELLTRQIRERWPLPIWLPGLQNTIAVPSLLEPANDPEVAASQDNAPPQLTRHRAEFYSFTACLVFGLIQWKALLAQFKHTLSTSSVEFYLKMGTLYTDLVGHEAFLDRYLELLKRDQLEETVSLSPLNDSLAYLVNLHAVHLSNQPVANCFALMQNFASAVLASSEAISMQVVTLAVFSDQALSPLRDAATSLSSTFLRTGSSDRVDIDPDLSSTSEILTTGSINDSSNLLVDICKAVGLMRSRARFIRRRLPNNIQEHPLIFGPEVAANIELALRLLGDTVLILYGAVVNAAQMASNQTDEVNSLELSAILTECLNRASSENLTSFSSTYSKADCDLHLRALIERVCTLISMIATCMEHGEFDFDGTPEIKCQEPFVTRAIAYRRNQSELEGCRARLESKDAELRELQMALKLRNNEVSEMAVRVGVAEKKLENAGKGSDEKIRRLEQRLEHALAQQKRTEKEQAQAIDALQGDLEVLEREKLDLKEKLRAISKKTLMENLIKSPLVSTGGSISTSISPTSIHKSTASTGFASSISSTSTAVNHASTTNVASPSLAILSTPVTGGTDAFLAPGSISVPIKIGNHRDAAFLLHELGALHEALKQVAHENIRLHGERMKAQLTALPVLRVPRYKLAQFKELSQKFENNCDTSFDNAAEVEKGQQEALGKKIVHADVASLYHISRDARQTLSHAHCLLALPRLVQLRLPVPGEVTNPECDQQHEKNDLRTKLHLFSPASQMTKRAAQLIMMKRSLEDIEKRIVDLVQIELPGGTVQADFARFPSARTRRFLTTGLARTSKLDAHTFLPHDPQDLPRCRLRIPRINAREQDSPLRTNYCCEPDVVKVSMASSELRRLHFKLIS